MKITRKAVKSSVMAAEDDFEESSIFDVPEDMEEESDDADIEESDDSDDDADIHEDFEEDDVAIDVDNNIVNHLIAECDNCRGIFISAMIASEQEVDSIKGICPLCNKETTQSLKWIIKEYPE